MATTPARTAFGNPDPARSPTALPASFNPAASDASASPFDSEIMSLVSAVCVHTEDYRPQATSPSHHGGARRPHVGERRGLFPKGASRRSPEGMAPDGRYEE